MINCLLMTKKKKFNSKFTLFSVGETKPTSFSIKSQVSILVMSFGLT